MSRRSRIASDLERGLRKQICYGQSKYEAKQKAKDDYKKHGGSKDGFLHAQGLYAYKSYDTYLTDVETFAKWAAEHTNAKDGRSARQYVHKYLKELIDKGRSAATVYKYAHALACAYGCKASDFGVALPRRRRCDITRSRLAVKSDKRFEAQKYEDIREFARGIGARHGGLEKLRACDIRARAGGGYEVFLQEKGGKKRWARVLPQYESIVLERFEQARERGEEEKLFDENIDHHIDVHACRAEYARMCYALYEAEGAASGKLYRCRADRLGDVYDKGILIAVSKELGHNRCDVVVNDYLK